MARQAPRPEVHRLEQLLRDPRALEHGAHEDEQRHRREHEVRGDVLDLVHELEDDGALEDQPAEEQRRPGKRERHVHAQEYEHEHRQQHPQGKVFAHRGFRSAS
jgi:hypothetical protein